jgi:hypothetical protein
MRISLLSGASAVQAWLIYSLWRHVSRATKQARQDIKSSIDVAVENCNGWQRYH